MVASSAAKSKGYLVAAVLAGAWRDTPPPLKLSAAELNEILPLLLSSGSGALAWRSVRNSSWRNSSPADQLRAAYHFYTLQAALHEQQIRQVVNLFRSEGVEPLLIKGWAIARLYPDKALRPSGDIDVCVQSEHRNKAEALLERPPAKQLFVDLIHEEVTEFDKNGLEGFFSRSQLVRLDDVDVRVPSPEDHLRLLSIHFLKHGGCLPRWLCDIGVAVEATGPNFDWQVCLGNDRQQADWILCALSLAHHLLEAKLDHVPAARRLKHPPKWLVSSVIKRWETLESMVLTHQRYSAPMEKHLRQRRGVIKAIYERWPDPLEASIRLKAPLNGLPRLPYQLANCWLRTAEVFKSFSKSSLRQAR